MLHPDRSPFVLPVVVDAGRPGRAPAVLEVEPAASRASWGDADRSFSAPAGEETTIGELIADGGAAPLGSLAKSVRRDRRDARRHQRLMLDTAARLLPDARVAACQRRPHGGAVELGSAGDRASWRGLQSCGSVWHCPDCAVAIGARRRSELRILVDQAPTLGAWMVMATFTGRHHRDQPLAFLVQAMKGAKTAFHRLKAWRQLKLRLAGHVTATEVTFGERSGWHLHFHQLLLVRAASAADAIATVEAVRSSWLHALESHGLDGNRHAFDVRDASAAANYVSKWGPDAELAGSASKAGRSGGRTPWQLLADAAAGDAGAAARWSEYAVQMHGRRQLTWSRGLKDQLGIAELSDDQAAERLQDAPEWTTAVVLDRRAWRDILRNKIVIYLLDVLEVDGVDAVRRCLDAMGIEHRPPPRPPPHTACGGGFDSSM